ncbi:calcium/proton exchanger [Tanacetum coccineum]
MLLFCGGGPDLIVDDGGDATLLIQEGVKAEEQLAKTEKVPDPNSTDYVEFQIMLSIIKEGDQHLQIEDQKAYDYLIQINPNSWSRAFFEIDKRCAIFYDGLSKSFDRAILAPRHKPIVTMLEETRLYIMQRLVSMNKIAFNLEDNITPRNASTSVDKGKALTSVEDELAPKRKRGWPPSHVDVIRIYHKNRGRYERIANMKLKKSFQFEIYGTGSTPNKAFDVDD